MRKCALISITLLLICRYPRARLQEARLLGGADSLHSLVGDRGVLRRDHEAGLQDAEVGDGGGGSGGVSAKAQ